MRRFALTAALLLVLGTMAPSETRGQKGEKTEHGTSITISPVHLLLPFFEITAEFQGNSDLGVAAIGGIGSIFGISAWELGGQMNYYAIGDFEGGLQLGGELLYLNVSLEDSSSGSSISAAARGLSVGPYIGWKTTASFGLTFFVQAGYSIILITARASDNQGNSTATSASGGAPMLNLNLGWSF